MQNLPSQEGGGATSPTTQQPQIQRLFDTLSLNHMVLNSVLPQSLRQGLKTTDVLDVRDVVWGRQGPSSCPPRVPTLNVF